MLCRLWQAGAVGGGHGENWRVDAFMPLSCCSQGALQECHNTFLSLKGIVSLSHSGLP